MPIVYAGENITDMPSRIDKFLIKQMNRSVVSLPEYYDLSLILADTEVFLSSTFKSLQAECVVTLVRSVIRLNYIPPFSSPRVGLDLSLCKSTNITMPCF